MMSVITFCDKKKEYRCLSNFWDCKVVIKDGEEERVYNSGELCFHGEKFVRLSRVCNNEERKKKLLEYGMRFVDGGDICGSREAKSRGGKGKNGFRLNEGELREWYNMSMEVQMEICKYKWENYEEVKIWLEKSRGCMLIHSIGRIGNEKMKERIWEGRMVEDENGNMKLIGENKLGEMWMKVRDGVMM